MRLAGQIPVDIVQLIAATDTSNWPSINEPRRAPTNHRYDEHMKEIVPSIPAHLRKA